MQKRHTWKTRLESIPIAFDSGWSSSILPMNPHADLTSKPERFRCSRRHGMFCPWSLCFPTRETISCHRNNQSGLLEIPNLATIPCAHSLSVPPTNGLFLNGFQAIWNRPSGAWVRACKTRGKQRSTQQKQEGLLLFA